MKASVALGVVLALDTPKRKKRSVPGFEVCGKEMDSSQDMLSDGGRMNTWERAKQFQGPYQQTCDQPRFSLSSLFHRASQSDALQNSTANDDINNVDTAMQHESYDPPPGSLHSIQQSNVSNEDINNLTRSNDEAKREVFPTTSVSPSEPLKTVSSHSELSVPLPIDSRPKKVPTFGFARSKPTHSSSTLAHASNTKSLTAPSQPTVQKFSNSSASKSLTAIKTSEEMCLNTPVTSEKDAKNHSPAGDTQSVITVPGKPISSGHKLPIKPNFGKVAKGKHPSTTTVKKESPHPIESATIIDKYSSKKRKGFENSKPLPPTKKRATAKQSALVPLQQVKRELDILQDISNTIDNDLVDSYASIDLSENTDVTTSVLAGLSIPNRDQAKQKKNTSLKKKVTGKENSGADMRNKLPAYDSKQNMIKKMGTSTSHHKATEINNLGAFKVKKKPAKDMSNHSWRETNPKAIPTTETSDVTCSLSNKDWANLFDQVINKNQAEDSEVLVTTTNQSSVQEKFNTLQYRKTAGTSKTRGQEDNSENNSDSCSSSDYASPRLQKLIEKTLNMLDTCPDDDVSSDLVAGNLTEVGKNTPPREPKITTEATRDRDYLLGALNIDENRNNGGEVELEEDSTNEKSAVVKEKGKSEKKKGTQEEKFKENRVKQMLEGGKKSQLNVKHKLRKKKLEEPYWKKKTSMKGTRKMQVKNDVSEEEIAAFMLDHKPSPKTASIKEKVLKTLEDVDETVWVQCEECDKWRQLPSTTDPTTLPDRWTCDMLPGENGSCQIPEDDWNLTSETYVYEQYVAGSVVWACIDNIPWWPGIVDIDPDQNVYICFNGNTVPTHYHVTFFGKPVMRAWVTLDNMKPFRKNDTHKTFSNPPLKDKVMIFYLREAVMDAHRALNMDIQLRRKEFAFVTRYTGKLRMKHTIISHRQSECTGTSTPNFKTSLKCGNKEHKNLVEHSSSRNEAMMTTSDTSSVSTGNSQQEDSENTNSSMENESSVNSSNSTKKDNNIPKKQQSSDIQQGKGNDFSDNVEHETSKTSECYTAENFVADAAKMDECITQKLRYREEQQSKKKTVEQCNDIQKTKHKSFINDDEKCDETEKSKTASYYKKYEQCYETKNKNNAYITEEEDGGSSASRENDKGAKYEGGEEESLNKNTARQNLKSTKIKEIESKQGIDMEKGRYNLKKCCTDVEYEKELQDIQENEERDSEENTERHIEKDEERNGEKRIERDIEKDEEKNGEERIERDIKEDEERNGEKNIEKHIEEGNDMDIEEDEASGIEKYTERISEEDIERDIKEDEENVEKNTESYMEENEERDIEENEERDIEENEERDMEEDEERDIEENEERDIGGNEERDIEENEERDMEENEERDMEEDEERDIEENEEKDMEENEERDIEVKTERNKEDEERDMERDIEKDTEMSTVDNTDFKIKNGEESDTEDGKDEEITNDEGTLQNNQGDTENESDIEENENEEMNGGRNENDKMNERRDEDMDEKRD
ncbi:hypothetical protein Pmani_000252 [Petrolisthes manimaculis]|uniref:Zinc finger CW-type PWWP domain protein 1 n=1 Tax=Petrolisthes manimaculis TaxID=1843537 RepID=A0AAE1QQI0_9EUCA|nr:hypothetical protein Pmani_000252 [Petrolisthes manimaculis]